MTPLFVTLTLPSIRWDHPRQSYSAAAIMLIVLSINARIADTHVSTVMRISCVPLSVVLIFVNHILVYNIIDKRIEQGSMIRIGRRVVYRMSAKLKYDFEKKTSSRRRIRSLICGQRQENNENFHTRRRNSCCLLNKISVQ